MHAYIPSPGKSCDLPKCTRICLAQAMRYLLPDPRQSLGPTVCTEIRNVHARASAYRASSFNVFPAPSHPLQHGSTAKAVLRSSLPPSLYLM